MDKKGKKMKHADLSAVPKNIHAELQQAREQFEVIVQERNALKRKLSELRSKLGLGAGAGEAMQPDACRTAGPEAEPDSMNGHGVDGTMPQRATDPSPATLVINPFKVVEDMLDEQPPAAGECDTCLVAGSGYGSSSSEREPLQARIKELEAENERLGCGQERECPHRKDAERLRARIKELEAENWRLRAALEKAQNICPDPESCLIKIEGCDVCAIAPEDIEELRAALNAAGKEPKS
jgi:predicted nuclease with TOPRIM domain